MTRSLEAEAAPEGRLQEAGPRPKGLTYLKLHLAVAMGICLPSTSRSEIASWKDNCASSVCRVRYHKSWQARRQRVTFVPATADRRSAPRCHLHKYLLLPIRTKRITRINNQSMAAVASASANAAVASERDVYGLSGNIKKDLLNYLDNIASSGDFATMKSFSKLSVSPHVRLLGADGQEEVEIGIPLGLQDAQKLIKVARQAPFGKGEQTILDTSFRNTWELYPSQFSLSDEWQPYVDVHRELS